MNASHRELALLLVTLGQSRLELPPHPNDAVRLRYRPAGLPPALAASLRVHKPSVLELLVGGHAPTSGTDAEYVFSERLVVADDLRMPTHPGSPAWLIAVGESLRASG